MISFHDYVRYLVAETVFDLISAAVPFGFFFFIITLNRAAYGKLNNGGTIIGIVVWILYGRVQWSVFSPSAAHCTRRLPALLRKGLYCKVFYAVQNSCSSSHLLGTCLCYRICLCFPAFLVHPQVQHFGLNFWHGRYTEDRRERWHIFLRRERVCQLDSS